MSSESTTQLCARAARETEFTARKVSDFVDDSHSDSTCDVTLLRACVKTIVNRVKTERAFASTRSVVQIIDTQLSRLSM